MQTEKRVIALGFFDGVHIGHGGLLRRTRETADRLGVPAAALTFDTHPDTLVSARESVESGKSVRRRAHHGGRRIMQHNPKVESMV